MMRREAMLLYVLLAAQSAVLKVSCLPYNLASETCTSEACVRRAGRLLDSLDTAAEPCEDFAQFSCGGRVLQDKALGTANSFGGLSRQSLLTTSIARKMLEGAEAKSGWSKGERTAHQFYQYCIASRLNSLLKHQLEEDITQALDGADPDAPLSLANVLRILRERFGVELLVLRNVINACEGNLSKIQVIVSASSEEQLLIDAFLPVSQHFNINMLNATMEMNKTKIRDKKTIKYANVTLTEVKKEMPDFDWDEYLHLPATDLNISLVFEEHVLSTLQLWERAFKYLGKHKNLVRTLVSKIATSTLLGTKDVKDGKSIAGTCYRLTAAGFGEAVMALFLRQAKTQGKVQSYDKRTSAANEILTSLRNALVRRLQSDSWLEQKDIFVDKLNSLRTFIGYPDLSTPAKREEILEQRYKTLKLSGNFATDLQRVALWKESQLAQVCNLDIIEIFSPLVLNAYYVNVGNIILVPASAMMGDIFEPELPSALNYGAFGFVLSHEIAHALDADNRHLDRWNNPIKLADAAESHLSAGKKCLTDVYGNLTEMGRKINGTLTLGENMADVVGIMVAYDGWISKENIDASLPGVSYSPSQLFFISYAQQLCDYLPENLVNVNDVHVPSWTRLLGTVSQSAGFEKAFKCSADAALVPKNRCDLW